MCCLTVTQGPWHILTLCVVLQWHRDLTYTNPVCCLTVTLTYTDPVCSYSDTGTLTYTDPVCCLTVTQWPQHILTLCVILQWHNDLDIYWPCMSSYSDLNIWHILTLYVILQWPEHILILCVVLQWHSDLKIYWRCVFLQWPRHNWPCMLSYSDLNIYWPCVLSYSDLNITDPACCLKWHGDLDIYWPVCCLTLTST